MATMAEKVILTGGFLIVAIAATLIIGHQAEQVAVQQSADPKAVATCSKISIEAHGPFSQNKEIAVMDECLRQLDPAYAKAQFAARCEQAKASGAKPDAFSDEFQQQCFHK